MSKAVIDAFVQDIHDSPGRVVIVAAGAGTHALAWLLGVAGASRTLLDASIPYSRAAFEAYIHQKPKKHVIPQTARLMAGNAYWLAHRLREAEAFPVVGLSCTATIVTDRPKRGDHRAHIAAWSRERVKQYSLVLAKGERDRDGEEEVVSRILLNALAEAFGLDARLELPLLPSEKVDTQTFDFARGAERLLAGDLSFFGIHGHGRMRYEGINPEVLLSGSFNPLHAGHQELAAVASEMLERPVAFEISAYNVDKPPLEQTVILDRLTQFAGHHSVYITNAPTFLEKARLFPETTFVIGVDTAVRILAPRYYDHSHAQMLAALHEMRDLGTTFLVAGRINDAGEFVEPDTLDIQAGFESLFTPIPAARFRRDISSTEIRAQEMEPLV